MTQALWEVSLQICSQSSAVLCLFALLNESLKEFHCIFFLTFFCLLYSHLGCNYPHRANFILYAKWNVLHLLYHLPIFYGIVKLGVFFHWSAYTSALGSMRVVCKTRVCHNLPHLVMFLMITLEHTAPLCSIKSSLSSEIMRKWRCCNSEV